MNAQDYKKELAYQKAVSKLYIGNLVTHVALNPYDGSEFSVRSKMDTEMIETLRKSLWGGEFYDVSEFNNACHKFCRDAWEAKADWFMKIVRSRKKEPHLLLLSWIQHWMTAYLTDRQRFLERLGMLVREV